MSDLPLPPGAPGSRTHYTFTITYREREAVQRLVNQYMVEGDMSLIQGVFVKIAAEEEPPGANPPLTPATPGC